MQKSDYENGIVKAKKKQLLQFIQNKNIAELLSDDKLAEIGGLVKQEFDIDEDSLSSKRDKWEKSADLFNQVVEQKNTPYENSSNVKYPSLTTACIQFNSRAYPAIMKGSDIVKVKAVGGKEHEGGENAVQYMNYQLLEEDPNWDPDTDRLLLMVPCWGTMFRKRWYSSLSKYPKSKILRPDQLIVNNACQSLETAPRISEIFELYPNDIESHIREGTFIPFTYETDRSDGDSGCEFIEQHRWLDLDEDGYKEPYIVTLYKDTSAVCRITANYLKDSVTFNDKGQVVKIDRNDYYTKYTFIPSIDGSFYDLGFADLLYPLNEAVNTSINLLLDAGKLSNSNTGLIGKDLRIGKGPFKVKIGEWKAVNARGQDIRNGLVQMQFPGPSPVLFQMLGLLIDATKEVSNIKDVLTGEQSANLPVGTTMALIEQGLKVFGAIFKRIHKALADELKILKRINGLYLNNQVYSEVLDKPVSREDFIDDGIDFVPVTDPNVVTDMQKMGRSQYLAQFMNDPFFNPMEIRSYILDAAGLEPEKFLMPPDQGPSFRERKEMIELQIQLAELELKQAEQARKDRLADVEAQEKTASAIEKVASAEAKEAGTQLDQYKAEIEEYDRGRMAGVASPPNNANIPQGPAPANQASQSGMGGGDVLPPNNTGIPPGEPGSDFPMPDAQGFDGTEL